MSALRQAWGVFGKHLSFEALHSGLPGDAHEMPQDERSWRSALTSMRCHRIACTRSMAAWRIAIATTSGIGRDMRTQRPLRGR